MIMIVMNGALSSGKVLLAAAACVLAIAGCAPMQKREAAMKWLAEYLAMRSAVNEASN